MATITASMVKDLREKTGAGMMDCKNALNEVGGDIETAVDWLRTKGLAKAAKKAGRTAAEGLIAIASSGSDAAMVEVNSETDFVARNEAFQAFARSVAQLALTGGTTVEELKGMTLPDGVTVDERLRELVATIGENMTIRRLVRLTAPAGTIGTYLHGSVGEGVGKIGVLVGIETSGDAAALGGLGGQIAQHVAAMNPVAVDASGVDAAVIERESAILREKNAGKPDNVLARIVESGLKSYYKENMLLDQPSVIPAHDGKTFAQVLKEMEGKVGKPVKLSTFVRYGLGEGIVREETDFAAEVAAQSGVGKKPDGEGA